MNFILNSLLKSILKYYCALFVFAVGTNDVLAAGTECQNCHMTKNEVFINKKNKTQLEHTSIHIRHGTKELACHYCHDKNNHNLLRTSEAAPASFGQSAGVCQQCHIEEYRDWTHGIHGKPSGGWKAGASQVPQQCIRCHEPHDVAFKKMKALKAPQRPKFSIPKLKE